jgi:hypothetical protein
MPTKRDTIHERDDQGGESPCFMCLLDEDGLMLDRRDMPLGPTGSEQRGERSALPGEFTDPGQCGPGADAATHEVSATA